MRRRAVSSGGCGEKVVTPLSPAEWQLSYDGEAISLHPSIGNSRFPCGLHYWVKRGQVVWAPKLAVAEAVLADSPLLIGRHFGRIDEDGCWPRPGGDFPRGSYRGSSRSNHLPPPTARSHFRRRSCSLNKLKSDPVQLKRLRSSRKASLGTIPADYRTISSPT
jgi:hypothetical protein